jgi:hypothetical protein
MINMIEQCIKKNFVIYSDHIVLLQDKPDRMKEATNDRFVARMWQTRSACRIGP